MACLTPRRLLLRIGQVKVSNNFLWTIVGGNIGFAALVLTLWTAIDTPVADVQIDKVGPVASCVILSRASLLTLCVIMC